MSLKLSSSHISSKKCCKEKKKIPNFSPCREIYIQQLSRALVSHARHPEKSFQSLENLCVKIYYLRNRIIFFFSCFENIIQLFFIPSDFKTLSFILKGLLPSSRHSSSLTSLLRKFSYFCIE